MKKKKVVKIIVLLIVVCIITSVFVASTATPVEYRTVSVKRGNIENIISGSGTIAASKTRKEYSKIAGEVKEVFFEEGDEVNSGDLIMKFDASAYENNRKSQEIGIEQTKLSIQTIEKQIADLTIRANGTGYINGLSVAEGAYVSTTLPVCNIVKGNIYEVVLPFMYNEEYAISVGDVAELTITSSFSNIDGRVTKVSDLKRMMNGNLQVVDITIEVDTTGYSLEGMDAKAIIQKGNLTLTSVGSAIITSSNVNVVRAKSTGTLKTLVAHEGMYVENGDVIAILENTDLETSLQNAKLSLKNQYNQLEIINDQIDDYNIVAPINGVITAQSVEEGDLVAAGMLISTISNNDTFEFKIPVDELDIAKINYDKKVEVTIDALPETETNPLEGKITSIPLEGVTTAGITDYYVTIEIEKNDDIKISMSANADITAQEAQNILYIPIDAISVEDDQKYVEIISDNEKNEVKKVEVETGISNATYVEVKSGLNEGELVVVPEASAFGGMTSPMTMMYSN